MIKKTAVSQRTNRGEIATTLTLITLGIMLLGTFLGTRQAVRQNVQKFLSSADSGSLCYQSGSCRNTTDTTSCEPTMECKNVSKTPFQNDYRCVTRGVSCTVSSPQSCWCLGTLTPTIIPTPSTTLRASPTPTTMLTSSPSSKDSSRLPQLFLTPTPIPTAKVEVISAPPVAPLTPAISSCPFESQSRLYEVDSQKAQQKNIDLTGENLPKWGLASFKTTASPPGSPQVTFDKNGFYQTGKLNLTNNAKGQYNTKLFYDPGGTFELVASPNGKYCDGAICPRPFNFGAPADTAQNLAVDCGKSGAYGWIFKRKRVGKMNLRIELSAGRDLSGNILYNASEFRVDPANLSGNLTLTGVNNSIVKTLLFTATNGVVNVTFDNIPAGQYKVSINMPNGQGLRDEYANEVESTYYDKNSVKRYIWKTVKAHLLNKSLYNETGKAIDTLYITQEATSIVRVIYDTNPAAGLVYTSNDACIQCQQEYCREDNYCTVKSEGRISGWNKFWCVAKFKKNGNGDPVQQPDGFFKSCKGEPPTGGGTTGCWCTNDTDCSKAAGKREVAPGQNYCRETGDVVCCVGGAKPSADQQKPNRCCTSDSDCNKFFNDGSKCSGNNSDCGSGKSCTIPQPTATPRPNANSPQTPPIPPTLAPSCSGFQGFAAEVQQSFDAPTAAFCPLCIVDNLYSGQCAGAYTIGAIRNNCPVGQRPIVKCEIDRSGGGLAGRQFTFQKCQSDSVCPKEEIGAANCNLNEVTFGSCGGRSPSTQGCPLYQRPRYTCLQLSENGQFVNRFVAASTQPCGYGSYPNECNDYNSLTSLLGQQEGKKEIADDCKRQLDQCDEFPRAECKEFVANCVNRYYTESAKHLAEDVVRLVGTGCPLCLCTAVPECAVAIPLLTVGHYGAELSETGVEAVAFNYLKEKGGDIVHEGAEKLAEKEIIKRVGVQKILELEVSSSAVKTLSGSCGICAAKGVEYVAGQIKDLRDRLRDYLDSGGGFVSINNVSGSRTVSKITLTICAKDSLQCDTIDKDLVVEPKGKARVAFVLDKDSIKIPIKDHADYVIECNIHYSDGSNSLCPNKLNFNSGTVSNITVTTNEQNEIEQVKIKPFRKKTPDINNDGEVNTIDYALVLKSYGKQNSDINEDVNDDGIINAIDMSIIIDNLGIKNPL